jgi:hypothetical protein
MPVNKDFYTISGSSGQSTGYTIDQSIRFNPSDTPKLTRTPSSTGNRDKWTFSAWVKRAHLTSPSGGGGNDQTIFVAGNDVDNWTRINFLTTGSLNTNEAADMLHFIVQEGGTNTYPGILSTNRLFRDTTAWYHIVAVYDSGNVVASERMRLYINGVRENSFANETYVDLNEDSRVNHASTVNRIGCFDLGTNKAHFGGYMAEIHLLDGYAYDSSYFGEFTENGIWIPKEYSGSYGTNGFKIDGRDATDLGDDESGNGNDFAMSGFNAGSGNRSQSLDSPTNNFCTWNLLDNYWQNATIDQGLLRVTTNSSNYSPTTSTFQLDSGKWYWEARLNNEAGSGNYADIGIIGEDITSSTKTIGKYTYGYEYKATTNVNAGKARNNDTYATYGANYEAGDIIGVAVDLDNNKLYFSKNGTYQNSGDPTSGSTGTGAISITAAASTTNGGYKMAIGEELDTHSARWDCNFGQDSSLTGSSSANTNVDASGTGEFHFAVPSGYKAICTKNLGS